MRGNWGGFSFEIETSSEGNDSESIESVATGAASRLRLKPFAIAQVLGMGKRSGNWGGFSFEIETEDHNVLRAPYMGVATGAASRLRLKLRRSPGMGIARVRWQLGRLLV